MCANLAEPYWDNPKLLVQQLALAAQQYFNYSSSHSGVCFDTTGGPVKGVDFNNAYAFQVIFFSASKILCIYGELITL